MTSRWYQPDEQETQRLLNTALRLADGDAALVDNHLFALLFNHETGIYARKNRPSLWELDAKGGWVRIKRRMSRRQWIEVYFVIQRKDGTLGPLKLNRAQRRLEARILRMERSGVPIRAIMLKARQMGFCGSPETRVLTADLRWQTLDEIAVGTEIVAVDENIPGGRGAARKMRTGVVQYKHEVFAPAFRLRMSNGEELTLTGGHRMLCRQRGGDSMRWRTAASMKVGDEIRFVTKPWGPASFEDGWFGGILDGEGSFDKNASPSVNACQLAGPVWDRMVRYLQDREYNFCIETDKGARPSKFGSAPVPKVVVGRMNELFRLMGQTRPSRFINKRWWEGRDLPGKRSGDSTASIVSIEALPAQRMIDLQTSTKTFIAEGFVSHNSTYVQAVMFEMELRETRVRGLIVADTGDRAETLLSIADTARAEMPKLGDNERWEFGMRSKAVYSLVWREPMLGQLRITSAEVREPGRGGTRKIVHMSETAHWQDAPLKMPGVLASLPVLPMTYGFNESTANGEGNQFAEDFWRGWEQRATPLRKRTFLWESLFFAWWEHEEYFWSKTVGGGRQPDPSLIASIEATLDDQEIAILAKTYFERGTPAHAWEQVDRKVKKGTVKVWRRVGVGSKKVSLDQIAWWRMKLEDPECHGDKNLRDQEYPWSPEVAFLVTGRKVFDARLLAEHAAKAPEPVWQGWIDAPLGAPPDPLVDEILDEVQRPQ